MEYGSVECGLMAHTRPSDGNYFVFWTTRLLQADKQGDGQYRNLVTRLTRTYVPLIRYDIGDYLVKPLPSSAYCETAAAQLEIGAIMQMGAAVASMR